MIAKRTKNKLWIALAVALVVLFGYVKISNYFANKPIKEGVDLVKNEQRDFTTAGDWDNASSVLRSYSREVQEMPQTRERSAFISAVKKADEVESDGETTVISVKEWNELNDKFQKIRDEYEFEEDEKWRKKRSYLNQ